MFRDRSWDVVPPGVGVARRPVLALARSLPARPPMPAQKLPALGVGVPAIEVEGVELDDLDDQLARPGRAARGQLAGSLLGTQHRHRSTYRSRSEHVCSIPAAEGTPRRAGRNVASVDGAASRVEGSSGENGCPPPIDRLDRDFFQHVVVDRAGSEAAEGLTCRREFVTHRILPSAADRTGQCSTSTPGQLNDPVHAVMAGPGTT
jgi:hypothetical protein